MESERLIYDDRDVEEGSWEHDVCTGKGRYIWSNSEYYIGELNWWVLSTYLKKIIKYLKMNMNEYSDWIFIYKLN